MHTKKLSVAAWEIGYGTTGLGTKVGGMGLVLQELPLEMAQFAQNNGQEIEIEVLSPCFRSYDREKLHYEGKVWVPHFNMDFEVYSHVFDDCKNLKIRHLYFWNESVLGGFGEKEIPQTIYPTGNWEAIRIYARVSAAIASYISINSSNAIHIHDYHLGFILFYLRNDLYSQSSFVFTIHNGSYQGWLEIWDDPAPVMYELSMSNDDYYRYFQYWGNFNTLKGVLIRMNELGGSITTVSEGYAWELKLTEDDIKKIAIYKGLPFPRQAFIPNNGLGELASSSIIGIENGLSKVNHASRLKYFKSKELARLQASKHYKIFRNDFVFKEMLSRDHNYTFENLENKKRLKQLLHIECFGREVKENDVLFCAVGRLVDQKNFGILLGVMDYITLKYPNARFIIVASAQEGDWEGQKLHNYFEKEAYRNPNVYFHGGFDIALSKFVLGGSDFCLIPSKFEPCGLIDYEAALLGTIPIVRETGGLTKTFPFSFGYPWYDIGDTWGETYSLSQVMEYAIKEYIHDKDAYYDRVIGCLNIDTSWENAVKKYFALLNI